jgi:trk system potassium uptake protein TrkH
MFLAGLNFGLYYGVLRGRVRDIFTNSEVRFYVIINLVVIVVTTATIYPRLGNVHDALRHGVFQTLAVTTTTGFMTEDFDTYPIIVRWLLLILSKLVGREIRRSVQPHAVIPVRLGNMVVPETVISSVTIFFAAYIFLFFAASAALTAMGLDIVTGMSAAIACLSSIGPGLAGVGPSQNYAAIPDAGKVILCLCMIAGRLEIFVLFAVFSRETWRR